jgi:hypothetical protein
MSGKKRNVELVAQQEENFPRGGGSGLAPIVHKQIREVRIYEYAAQVLLCIESKANIIFKCTCVSALYACIIKNL